MKAVFIVYEVDNWFNYGHHTLVRVFKSYKSAEIFLQGKPRSDEAHEYYVIKKEYIYE